jgi:hypothetical protein
MDHPEGTNPMSRNYGYHLQEVVADVHHAVTNLTEQDKESRHQQLTRWHTTDTAPVHINEVELGNQDEALPPA